jgi:uncharacterized Zn finger protein (UPF0148 family)
MTIKNLGLAQVQKAGTLLCPVKQGNQNQYMSEEKARQNVSITLHDRA